MYVCVYKYMRSWYAYDTVYHMYSDQEKVRHNDVYNIAMYTYIYMMCRYFGMNMFTYVHCYIQSVRHIKRLQH